MNQKQELKELYESVTGNVLDETVQNYLESKLEAYNSVHTENHLKANNIIAYLQKDIERNRLWVKQTKVEQSQWSGITLGHTEKISKMQKNILTLGLSCGILALVLIIHLCVAYF